MGHHSRVSALCCNSDDLCLYSGAQDRFVLQWDARTLPVREEEEEEATDKKRDMINPYTVDAWSSSDEENS